MRLCNYRPFSGCRGPVEPYQAGAVVGRKVVSLATELGEGPLTPEGLAHLGEAGLPDLSGRRGQVVRQVEFGPPVLPVRSFRDFYAFEEHVRTARGRRGLEMVPEWYDFPVFYFSNADAILAPWQQLSAPPYGEWLDFELEVGCVIGRSGRDIPVEEAEDYVAGYCVLNDWSLRDVQRQEMKVGLGPAKGKDFATSLGPHLVTPDELADRRSGKGYDLAMTAEVNGWEVSRGNWKTIHFGFAEMIARASQGVFLRPGDLLGSGTVGTGCILERGPEAVGGWLKPGDRVELNIERLGTLHTHISEALAS